MFMHCVSCGTENPKDANFCKKCGASFNDVLRQAQTTTGKLAVSLYKYSIEMADSLLAQKELRISSQKIGAIMELKVFMIFLCMVATREIVSKDEYDALSLTLIQIYAYEHPGTKADEILARLNGYEEAMREKRGPLMDNGKQSWLWPLSHRVLQNIRGDEAKDPLAMFVAMAWVTKFIDGASRILNDFKKGPDRA